MGEQKDKPDAGIIATLMFFALVFGGSLVKDYNPSYIIVKEPITEYVILEKEVSKPIEVVVSAYVGNQKHASQLPSRPGTIAVSEDLFIEEGYTFNKRAYIRGYGVYIIDDLTDKKWKKRVDIKMTNKQAALNHGLVKTTISLIPEG